MINIQWGLQGTQELINLHPLFVHFPIALLLAAIVFYFLGILFWQENFLTAGKWTFYGGVLSAAAAVWTGFQAANTVPHGQESHETLIAHQYLGIGILIVGVLLGFWILISKSNLPRAKSLFLISLLLLAALITQQADFGGRLVFLHGLGVSKKSMVHTEVETQGHEHHHHEH